MRETPGVRLAPGTQVIGKPFTRAALLARVTRALADGAGEDTSAGQWSPRGSGASKRWLAGRELPGGSATSF